MKRDMGLVRKILLYIRERDQWSYGANEPSPFPGFTPTQVVDHIRQLIDRGDVTGIDASSFSGAYWLDMRLSWQGQDNANLIAPENRWKSALDTLAQKGVAVTIDAVFEVLGRSVSGG